MFCIMRLSYLYTNSILILTNCNIKYKLNMNKILSHSQSAKLIEYLTIEPVSSTRAVDASVHSNKPIKIKKINPSQFSLIYRRKNNSLNQSPSAVLHRKKLSSLGAPNVNILPMINKSHLECFSSNEINNINRSFLEFRTYYLLKIAKTTEVFEAMRDKCKGDTLNELHNKIKKITEVQSKILLDPKINSIFFNEKGLQNQIKMFYEIFNSVTRYIKILYDGIKSENDKLLQFQFKQKENELNTKLINKQSIKEEESVKQKEIKKKTIESSNTTDKENAMMIKIKHLEEETNDLSKLLDENKFYYLKYKEQIEQLNKKEVEISNLNVKYIKELKSKDIDLGLFRNEINEKNDIIDSLNAKIKELTEKLDIAINSNINLNKEKIELNRMINQLMENIYMNKEEISTLVIMLRNEQSQHNITKQTMISLESVISNIKEKQKRNEFITNVVNSSIK